MGEFRRFVVLLAGCLLAATGHAASDRPIRQVVSELRTFQGGVDQMDVPPRVAANLTALKHTLRDLIVEVAESPDGLTVTPDVLKARIVERLEREDVPVGDQGGFGAIPEIALRRPPEYPAWLIATTSLSIPYGLDTSLYLFEVRGGAWKHALTVESNGYATITGAQGWLTYHVSPPAPGRKPYLVTADITPSEASVWQGLRVKVQRVGKTPETPLVLASRSLNYCLDDAYYFSMRADGFGLIYLTWPHDRDLAGYRGVHYLEYAVDETRALRVEELTVDPYNVVRKWASEDWPIALGSVEAPARESLRGWRQRFRTGRWACGMGALRVSHQVEGAREQLLAVAGCTKGSDKTASAYVVFAAGRFGFRIASVSSNKPAWTEGVGETVWNGGGPGLTDPILEKSIQPKLPAGSPVRGRNTVKVPFRIVVNADGSVDPAVTIREWPLSDDGIIVPAIKAVRQWRYKPGLKDGHPVKVSIDVDVIFER